MSRKTLRTSDIARAVGAHPNTVRRYEEWGFLPPIPRSPSGYRRYTPMHLEQMRLAWLALHTDSWYEPKRLLAPLVRTAAAGDLGGALEQVYGYLAALQAALANAEAAAAYLERWAAGRPADPLRQPLRIGQVARLLGVTHDQLRSWERNGLLDVPRDPRNGYRLYGGDEVARLRVIRMLRQAGYSVMAILRMVLALDAGQTDDLRGVLDTPRVDEDVFSVADRWLTALHDYTERGQALIAQIERMMALQETLERDSRWPG